MRANFLAATSDKAPGEIVNVASGVSSSLVDLIATLKQVIGSSAAGLEIEAPGAPRRRSARVLGGHLQRRAPCSGTSLACSSRKGSREWSSSFRGVNVKAA